ncbi:MAG: hypothetical protein Q7S34_01040 [bacterium]|nr:hypothetical protein [bacterium]
MNLRDNLIGQIEIFESLELKSERDYVLLEKELTNPEFKKIVGQIRFDEINHAKLCREIIEFLEK